MRQDSAAEGGAILSRCVMGRVRGYCNSADYARPLGLAFIFSLPPDLKASFRSGEGEKKRPTFRSSDFSVLKQSFVTRAGFKPATF